jgi:hypothetical protein
MRRILRRSVAASAGSIGGGAAKKRPRARGPGFEIAKIDESVDQKLTRTPVVKAVLFM